MTQIERIQKMNAQELAKLIVDDNIQDKADRYVCRYKCEHKDDLDSCTVKPNCLVSDVLAVKMWLESEVKE